MERTPLHEVARLQRPGPITPLREAHDVPLNGSAEKHGADKNGADKHSDAAGPVARGPRVNIERSQLDDRPIVMPSDPGPAAHAYRMLRAQLLQRVRVSRARTIGIVSAADREGKTLTAVNLALSLAVEPNQTVLLADLDLHRPSVASTLKLRFERGLESWFAGSSVTIEDITSPVHGFERLCILPTLVPVPGSSETLASPRTQDMLRELRSSDPERLVLLDLPPLLLTDDFMTIASHLDGVVVVAREGRTKRDDLSRMAEILGSVRILGTVLNHSSQFERRAY